MGDLPFVFEISCHVLVWLNGSSMCNTSFSAKLPSKAAGSGPQLEVEGALHLAHADPAEQLADLVAPAENMTGKGKRCLAHENSVEAPMGVRVPAKYWIQGTLLNSFAETGTTGAAPSPRLAQSEEADVILIEGTAKLWGGDEWGAAYLWTDA